MDVGARQRGGLEQHEQAGERRPQLVRDGGGEAGAELLVGRELRQGREEEHERRGLEREGVLADPAAGRGVSQQVRRGRAGRHEPALVVEDHDRFRQRFHQRPDACRLLVYHPFTTPSPFGTRRHPTELDNDTMPKVLIVEDDEVIARGWRATSAPRASTPPGSGTATRGSRGSATRSRTPACSI